MLCFDNPTIFNSLCFLHVNFDVTFDIKLETVFFTFKIQISLLRSWCETYLQETNNWTSSLIFFRYLLFILLKQTPQVDFFCYAD